MLSTAVIVGIPIEVASWESLGWIALAALVPQLIGHTLMTWSLRYTKPTAVGVATVSEPVASTALGWAWLGEAVGPVAAVGCSITLFGVLIAALRPKPAQRDGPTPSS